MRNLEYTPIQTETGFNQWLTQQEQSGETTTTPQLAEAYFFILQQVDHGHSINLDLLRRIQKLYSQGLLNGRPDDPNTVASVIKYVGERMPTQIFRSNLKAIHFTNSTSEIMDVVHVSRAPGRVKRRKFAPNRSRWYVRNEIDEKHLELTFHVRDVLLQDPSDAFEMLSWLGSLEQARESVIAMIERGEDISPIKIAFRDLYTKHIQSEIEMLRKKKVAIKNIDKELTLSINFRLEELFERMKNLDSLSAELLVEWLSDERGEVVICQAHSNQKTLGGISGIKEPNAAEMTLGAAKETIEKEGLETPTDILFGNDFSMRIFLSIGLFSDQEFEYLKKTFESKKEKIQSSLDKLENQDVREAAEKFFLIQQLSQYTQGDLVMQGLRERLFSPETFEKIGIKRLVATVDSPIADPVDLIDLTKIGPEICNNLPKFLQEIILQLRENNRVILSVPYTLGNLANTTLEAAVKTFPSLDSENFIGKVGLFSTGTDDVSVGDVVLSNQVFSQFEGAGRPVENSIAPLITQYGYPVRIGSLLTTAGLTFQESAEMAAMHGNDPESKIYLDMEAAHLQDALANLSLDSNHVYYVSDKTRDPNSFDHQLHAGEKISESLGARGSIPLFICLLAVLENIGHGK